MPGESYVDDWLVEWAADAGFTYAPAGTDGGIAYFWEDPGGEIRYFIREDERGWLAISSADRAGSEKFLLSVSSSDVLARYFAARFGNVIRRKHGLPTLRLPSKPEDLAGGYSLSDYDGHRNRRTLFGEDGAALAEAREKTLSIMELVELSTLLGPSLTDIQTSFQNATGAPLFSDVPEPTDGR